MSLCVCVFLCVCFPAGTGHGSSSRLCLCIRCLCIWCLCIWCLERSACALVLVQLVLVHWRGCACASGACASGAWQVCGASLRKTHGLLCPMLFLIQTFFCQFISCLERSVWQAWLLRKSSSQLQNAVCIVCLGTLSMHVLPSLLST